MKVWGNDEFDHVRAIANNDEEANENTKIFSNIILKRKETSTSQAQLLPQITIPPMSILKQTIPQEKSHSRC
jgi:hypothetical protein